MACHNFVWDEVVSALAHMLCHRRVVVEVTKALCSLLRFMLGFLSMRPSGPGLGVSLMATHRKN